MLRNMVRKRTPRIRSRQTSNVAESVAAYGGTVRFNLVVPQTLKAAIDRHAAVQGVSGPELARRLLEDGLSRLEEQALWAACARVAPRVVARDRALLDRMDRWESSWDRAPR